jgi:hypothetical protein
MGGGVGGGVGSLATSLKLRKSIVNRFNSIYKNNIRLASRIVLVNYFYLVHSTFTPYPNYGMNWMILDFSIVEQLLVLASRINYSKNTTFFSKNHTRSRGVASGTICTNIHVLNVLYSILLICAVSPRKAPRPSLPLAPLLAGGRYAPNQNFPRYSQLIEHNNIKKTTRYI